MLKIKDEEFEDGLSVIFSILKHDYQLVDIYIDKDEITHVTFRSIDNDDKKH